MRMILLIGKSISSNDASNVHTTWEAVDILSLLMKHQCQKLGRSRYIESACRQATLPQQWSRSNIGNYCVRGTVMFTNLLTVNKQTSKQANRARTKKVRTYWFVLSAGALVVARICCMFLCNVIWCWDLVLLVAVLKVSHAYIVLESRGFMYWSEMRFRNH